MYVFRNSVPENNPLYISLYLDPFGCCWQYTNLWGRMVMGLSWRMDIPFEDLNGSNVINASGTFSCLGHIWKIKMVWCNTIYHLSEIWCSLLKVIVDCCTSMWQTRWHLIPVNATFLKVHHLQTYKSTIYWIGSLIIRTTLSHACNIYVTHDILGFLLIRHLDSSLFLRRPCEHSMSQHVFTGKHPTLRKWN